MTVFAAAISFGAQTFGQGVAEASLPVNLIGNPGFEQPLGGSQVCSPAPQSVGNWLGCHQSGVGPQEVSAPNPVHSGQNALQISTAGGCGTGSEGIQDFTGFSPQSGYTLSAWVYPDQGDQEIAIAFGWDRGSGGDIGTSSILISLSSRQTSVSAWGQSLTGPGVAADQWHQLTMVADGTKLAATYFIDGTPIGSTKVGSSVPNSDATVMVGQTASCAAQASNYYFDDVSLIGSVSVSVPTVTPQGAPPGADQQGGCACASGDPVDDATGDFYDSTVDLSIPGAGVPLTFSRTYDAEAAQAAEGSGALPGPLGYGWSDTLGMNLSYSTSLGIATITQGNGAQITFRHDAQGTSQQPWCPPDAGSDVYCPQAPRYLATLTLSGSTWTYTTRRSNPVAYTFGGATSAPLTAIADQNGDTLTDSPYSSHVGWTSCPTGDTCSAWSSLPAGVSVPINALVEAFNSNSQLVQVFGALPGEPSASFGYTGPGCSTWGSGLVVDVCSATDPGAITTTYAYDTSRSSPYRYDEVLMAPPATGMVANTFDGVGRVAEQSTQTGTVNRVMDFTYSLPNSSCGQSGASTTQVVTYPNGKTGSNPATSTATFDFSDCVEVATTDVNGATTYSYRDPTTLHAHATIDSNGNLSQQVLANYADPGGSEISSANVTQSTDARGNITQYQYTADNLPWCKVDPADYQNGVRCPATEPTIPPAPGTDPFPGVALTFYNGSDQVTYSSDPLGNTTGNSYTSGISGIPNGLPYCTVDPVGYKAGTVCAPYGSTPNLGTTTKTFDGAGDVLTSTDADGHTTTSCYYSETTGCAASAPASGDGGNPALLYSTTDPDGTTTSYTYDSAGRVLTQSQAFRGYVATTLSAYDPLGRKFCTVAPAEAAKGTTCPSQPPTTPPTPSANPTSTTDPYLGATISTFDAVGRVIQETSPIGGVTLNAYDVAGKQVCTAGPLATAGGVTCATPVLSAPIGTLCSSTPVSDPDAGATVTIYNSLGQVAEEINPLGGSTLYSYDPDGNKTCQTDYSDDATNAPPVTTTYTYDANNNVSDTTVAPGTSVAATTVSNYDPNGNVYCSVSPKAYAGSASAYQCPTWQSGWIASPPLPDAFYSATPTATQAKAVSTSFYDSTGKLRQQTSATGGTSTTAYDSDGRSYCSVSPDSFASWETVAANTATPYPYACPAPTATPPANSGYTFTVFDTAGHPIHSADAAGNTTTTTYGPDGEKLIVTAPGNQVTTNCYYWQSATCAGSAPASGGAANSLYTTTTPQTTQAGGTTTTVSTYLPGGAVSATTTPSGTITDQYTADGSLATVSHQVQTGTGYGQVANDSYSYLVDGSRSTMTDGSGVTSYTYDDDSLPTQKSFLPATGSTVAASTITYGYFSNGQAKTIGYPATTLNANPTVTHTYDAAGNLATVTDWNGHTTTVSHNPDGNVSNTAYPNGTSVATTQDLAGATTSISAAPTSTPSSPLAAFSTPRTPGEQVASETDTGAVASSNTYTYDAAQRLGSVNGTNTVYDPASDPTTLGTGATQAFNGGSEVTSATSGGVTSTLSYNSAGDRTGAQASNGSSTQYSYDQNNQLTGSLGSPTSTGGQVSAGFDHTVALSADGTVTAWGNNGNGQLGNNTTISSTTPVTVHGLSKVIAVSAGYQISAALEADGTVWTWGNNSSGQLGDGNTTSSSVPVQVSGLVGVTSISAGGFSMLAVKSNGTVVAWGDNSQGELGNTTTTTSSSTPVAVSNLVNVTSVSNGFWLFSAALKSDGSVWTWGWNGQGELGNNTTTSSTVPVQVTGLPLIASISAGGGHMMALDTSRSVWTWGINSSGQLGNNTTTNAIAPVQLTGITATSVSAGSNQSAVLLANGTVSAWGSNGNGQLGIGTTTNTLAPSTPMQGINNAVSISDGGKHMVMLRSNGTVAAVGADGSGQLGDGTTVDKSIPVTSVWNAGGKSPAFSAYTYNGDGLRVGETTTTGAVSFAWDTTSSNPEVLNDSTYSFIYGDNGHVIEQIDASGVSTYFVQDQLGSTRVLTNSSGSVVGTYTYGPYGQVTSHTGNTTTPIGYAGAYTDTSGLVYLVHRYYDPQTGEFLSVDPLVSQTQIPYGYAGNDPVNKTDPSGQCLLGFIGNCGPTAGSTTSGVWTTVHPTGLWSANVPGDSLVVYKPFFDAVNSNAPIGNSLDTLWFGLYQHGNQSTVNADGAERLSIFQGSAEQFTSNPSECLSGTDSIDFACSVSDVLIGYQSAATGAPGIQAYDYFLQQGERSLAYLVYANSENSTLNQLYLAADELLKELYSRDAKGKDMSYTACSSTASLA
jgi:RHS repeat-associated protein